MNQSTESESALLTEQLKEQAPPTGMFQVPEGYFGDFAKQMEQRIASESKPRAVVHRLRRWMVAASLLLLIGTSSYFIARSLPEQSQQTASVAGAPADVEDYVMMDNDAIYAYMANN